MKFPIYAPALLPLHKRSQQRPLLRSASLWAELRSPVLHAPNGERVRLIVVVPVGVLDVVVHAPEVGVAATVLASTPPDAVVADTVETAIRIADTARQSRKSMSVFA